MLRHPPTVHAAASVGLSVILGLSACAQSEETAAPYDRVGVPAVPDRTRPITEGPLPDGDYWATTITVSTDGQGLEVQLVQAVFGPTCTAELGAAECAAGFAVIEPPTIELAVDPNQLTRVSVVGGDRRNFSIDGTELLALVGGAKPAAMAPAEYRFVPYPFLVAVRNGSAVEIRQIWVE